MSPANQEPKPLDRLLRLVAQAETEATQAAKAATAALNAQENADRALNSLRNELKRRVNLEVQKHQGRK